MKTAGLGLAAAVAGLVAWVPSAHADTALWVHGAVLSEGQLDSPDVMRRIPPGYTFDQAQRDHRRIHLTPPTYSSR